MVKGKAIASARSEVRVEARALSESEAHDNSESTTLARAEAITRVEAITWVEAITRVEASFLADASEHAKAEYRQMGASHDRSADRARKRTDVFDKISNAAITQIQTVSQDEATAASSVFAKFDTR